MELASLHLKAGTGSPKASSMFTALRLKCPHPRADGDLGFVAKLWRPRTHIEDDRPHSGRPRDSTLREWYVLPRRLNAGPGPVSASGRALCPTGDTHEGESKDGKLNGRGMYTMANGMCLVVP